MKFDFPCWLFIKDILTCAEEHLHPVNTGVLLIIRLFMVHLSDLYNGTQILIFCLLIHPTLPNWTRIGTMLAYFNTNTGPTRDASTGTLMFCTMDQYWARIVHLHRSSTGSGLDQFWSNIGSVLPLYCCNRAKPYKNITRP